MDLIRFVKRAQALGLSLRDVQELLGLRSRPRASSARVRRLFEAKRAEVECQLRQLQVLKGLLDDLLGRCDGRAPVASCPILKHLSTCEESVDEG